MILCVFMDALRTGQYLATPFHFSNIPVGILSQMQTDNISYLDTFSSFGMYSVARHHAHLVVVDVAFHDDVRSYSMTLAPLHVPAQQGWS